MLSYEMKNSGDESLYHFLYRSIRNDILAGHLEADQKLPSKRPFARQLGVSVVTVENAYAQLLAEGFIWTQPRKGFFVSAIRTPKESVQKQPALPESRESREEKSDAPTELVANFADNQLEESSFPFSTWATIARRVLGERQRDLLKRSPHCGVRELRVAIAKMLFDFRGLSVDPECIVVGAGTDCLYSWLVQLLGFDKKYGVEDPGYSKISKIYRKLNVVCHFIPMDENGIRIDQLEETCTDVVHISPSHHFPTGRVMPISRRYELLGWASRSSNRYIVEDEYDSEFRMVGHPIPSLQSIDVQEKTIYINSFTKTLASTVRVGYMVLPKSLAQRFRNEFSFYTCTVSNLEQYVLATYIAGGFYEKHINRMRNFYRGRRDFLIEAIRQSRLKDFVEIAGQDAGLHFILKVKTDLKDEDFCALLREKGVFLRALSDYYAISEPSSHEFVVNYSSVPQNKIPLAVQKIAEVLKLG